MKDLYEALEIHDELNPKLFNQNEKLKPDVRQKMLEIVDEFLDNVQSMTDITLNPIDIYLLGSNASYNYTQYSDADVHIVVNFDTIDDNTGLVQALMNLQKADFNSSYDVSIHGIDVELYVEDVRSSTMSNGIYSVMNDDWVKKPNPITDVPEIDIEDDLDEWKEKINDILSSNDRQKISDIIDELYILRKNSLLVDGNEFGKGNQIFKEIRNLGLLGDLKDKYMELRSKELSLEHYKRESVEYTDSIKSNPIVYESDDIVITQPKWSTDIVYVYQVSDYQTPIRGNSKTGWLNAGTWKLKRDNLWHKDLSYKYSSIGARDFDEIAEITRSDSKLENKRRNTTMIPLRESLEDLWFYSIENEEEALTNPEWGISDKKIDYIISTYDNVERLLKARRSDIVFISLNLIEEYIDPEFISHFKRIKTIQKYNLALMEDDKGNKIVTEPRYGTLDVYFKDEDTARDILAAYEVDFDTYEEEPYTPSSTNRDYGPSNPWDAPGMSTRDFI